MPLWDLFTWSIQCYFNTCVMRICFHGNGDTWDPSYSGPFLSAQINYTKTVLSIHFLDKAQIYCFFRKIWLLTILRFLPFILETNFRMSSKSWGSQSEMLSSWGNILMLFTNSPLKLTDWIDSLRRLKKQKNAKNH